MILSFLTNTRVVNDNERFFNLVHASVQKLNRKEALFALVRIKNYKDPMYLRDTVITLIIFILGLFKIDYYVTLFSKFWVFIIFYGMVSLSWYFTHRKKIYMRNVLEDFLADRISQFEKNESINRNSSRKYLSAKHY